MMLDLVDQAFMDHWNAEAAQAPREAPAAIRPVAPAVDGDLVDRLRGAAGPEWAALADAVESARRRGRRTIAITACEPASGCTTIVDGLVRVLAARGRDAMACDRGEIPASGPTNDKRILLVDAGVWFPPGRIHRQRLMIASAGCDAAILVCKGDRPPPASWSVVLEAIGVEPLGEVASFVPPSVSTPAEATRP